MGEKCPKCDSVMEAGKLGSYGGVRWSKSMWWWRGQEVVAYRCEKCGYIELYA